MCTDEGIYLTEFSKLDYIFWNVWLDPETHYHMLAQFDIRCAWVLRVKSNDDIDEWGPIDKYHVYDRD